MSSTSPTQRDQDCAFLAREALFPLKIQRDGSHPTQFPAAEAVAKVRDAAMVRHADRASSSFFPRGIVVVHDVSTGELQWNGQPNIDTAAGGTQVPVIPGLLSIRACICGDKNKKLRGKDDAYIQRKPDSEEHEIVLCSDRLLKKDYTRAKLLPDETPQSLLAIETALAHHVTVAGAEITRNEPLSCAVLAEQQVQAARAAECYYSAVKSMRGRPSTSTSTSRHSSSSSEVKRGPSLGHPGFSWYPASIRQALQDRCVRAVAMTRTVCEKPSETRRCVADAVRGKSQ